MMRFGSHMWGNAAFGGFTWMHVGGIVLGVAVLALVVVAIIALVRTGRRAPKSESLEILKARFARGEITKEQYEEMHKTLAP